MKNNKGITLIALIITIIVMIILSLVAIQVTIGENGIITNAKEASYKTEKASKQEEVNFVTVELVAKNGGDATSITPQMIADRLNEIKDRGITAEPNNYFPTEIVYPATATSINKEIRIAVEPLSSREETLGLYIYEVDDTTKKAIITGINQDYKEYTGLYNWKIKDNNEEIKVLVIPNEVNIGGIKYVVNDIGNHAFSHCTSLTNITIPNGVIGIGDWVFSRCTNLSNITMPNTLTRIGSHAFADSTSLTNITIPDSVTTIGGSAFADSTSLTNITIPNGVTILEDYLFYDCYNLSNITMPNTLTRIGSNAFDHCISLTNITIPDSVTTIGSHAFAHCDGLTSITIPDSVTDIRTYPFWNSTNLANINVDINNNYYSSENGILFNQDKNVIICYPAGKIETIYEIPNSVTHIDPGAFSSSILTNIIIPDDILSIGAHTFADCDGLTSITIPDSVISIGGVAFADCDGLTSITIPSSVTSIGIGAFFECDNLVNINLRGATNSITGSPWDAPNATITWNY